MLIHNSISDYFAETNHKLDVIPIWFVDVVPETVRIPVANTETITENIELPHFLPVYIPHHIISMIIQLNERSCQKGHLKCVT